MQYFLVCSDINKKYNLQGVDNFDELRQHILDQDCVLILNITSLNYLEISDEIEEFLKINKTLKIIVHAINTEVKLIKKFFDKGIKGFLGYNASSKEFFDAINHVTEGNVYVNHDAKNALLNYICNVEDESSKKLTGWEDITAREKDVLFLICEGLRSKEIAEKLFISPHTVDSHRRNMMLKFNLNNSSKLVKFAMENRLVKY
jgi:DNA-binding NarL/FixJ family response regulator